MKIDCLFIGHNDIPAKDDIRMIKMFGNKETKDPELENNNLKFRNKYYSTAEIFNQYSNITKGEENKNNQVNMGNFFHLAIAYLVSYIAKRGFSYDFVNSFTVEKEALRQKLEENEVMTVGIGTTFYLSPYPIIDIIKFVRKYNQTCKIIVAGPFIFQNAALMEKQEFYSMLRSIEADFYIHNFQGEQALVKLLDAIKNKKPYKEVPNIYYKEGYDYLYTYKEQEVNVLEQEKIDWSLLKGKMLTDSVSVRSSVSCNFSCAFCTYPVHAGKYQNLCVEAIEEELDKIKQIGNVTTICFIDDTFNIPMERFKNILRIMIEKEYHFKWCSYIRCQFLDEETVQLMKKSGCVMVFLGIESGAQTVLDNMNKHAKVESYIEPCNLLRKYGILTYDSFIVGFPGETRETVQATVDFINRTKPDFYRVSTWFLDTKSNIAKKREEFGIVGQSYNWKHDTMDAKTAHSMFTYMVDSVQESVYSPCSINEIMTLLNRGMTVEQVKEYLCLYNHAIKIQLRGENINCDELEERFRAVCEIKR